MSSVEPVVDYELLEPIPVWYGCTGIVISVAFFQILNQSVLRWFTPSAVVDSDLWKWRNLFISWVHALIIGTWDLISFYRYPELTTDLIAFHNLFIYFMVAFSTGYFIHDFIDIIANKQLDKMWEVIPHHIAVAAMFFYNIVECRCIAYNVVALLAEVNTVFLHSRKLLQMCRIRFDHPLYRFNSAMNLFTFVACRFLCLAWIVYGMCIWYDRVSPVYLALLAASMFVMWVINVVLFWRLLSSDYLRPHRKHTADKVWNAAQANGATDKTTVANGEHHPIANGDGAPVANGNSGAHFYVNSNNNKHDKSPGMRNGMKPKLQ